MSMILEKVLFCGLFCNKEFPSKVSIGLNCVLPASDAASTERATVAVSRDEIILMVVRRRLLGPRLQDGKESSNGIQRPQ